MTTIICGVDVSSQHLDAKIGRSGPCLRVDNSAEGIAKLAAFCRKHSAGFLAMEATGGYEEEPLAALIAAGIETRRVNPREVHHFARAAGQLAKTDQIDARMLALFAERIRPPARALSDPEREQLKALVGTYRAGA